MKKIVLYFFTITFILLNVVPTITHAQIADGTYNVQYQANKPGSSSASMANDYFSKPATLIVKNGKQAVQLTINKSAWVTEFQPPSGASVVRENKGADTRTVQFSVTDLTAPVTIAMKIDIDDIDYHHRYSVDFVFDAASVPTATATTSGAPKVQQNTNNNTNTEQVVQRDKQTQSATVVESVQQSSESLDHEERVANPQTSDTFPIVYVLLALLSVAFFVFIQQVIFVPKAKR